MTFPDRARGCRGASPLADSFGWIRRLRALGAAFGLALLSTALWSAGAASQGGAPPAPTSHGEERDTITLTLAEVRRRTLQQNPAYLAESQETAIAGGALRQARVFRFNPDLALQSTGATVGLAGAPYELTLMQEVEWAGQRGLRIDAARTGLTRATYVVRNAGRLTLARASVGFYRALAAERRIDVARDALGLTERLVSAVRIQLSEGEISTLEGNLAAIEFGRARGRVLAAQREAESAMLELKRLAGISPETFIRLAQDSAAIRAAPAPRPVQDAVSAPMPRSLGQAPPNPILLALNDDSLLTEALARRPDLAASVAAVRELEELTALARRERIPNLRIGAAVDRGDRDGSARVGPALGLTLPFFNRNQGQLEQRRAMVEQAQLERQAVELRIRTEVANAIHAYRTASEEAAIFESSVLLPARANSELLETAFRAGKIALPTLLLLRNQLLDAELGYWDAWLARREAQVQLDAATGALQRTAPVTSSSQPDLDSRSESANRSRTSQ